MDQVTAYEKKTGDSPSSVEFDQNGASFSFGGGKGTLTATAKDLKANYTKINKGYKAVEDSFISEATVVFDALEKEFKPYRDYLADKKQAALDKKNEAINKAAKEANEKAQEATQKMAKTNAYNKIKYDIINRHITEKATDLVLTANKATLLQFQKELNGYTYQSVTASTDDSILDQEVKAELLENFNASKEKSKNLIENRLKAIETETENIVHKAKEWEPSTNNHIEVFSKPVVVPPVPPVPDVQSEYTDDDFLKEMNRRLNEVLHLVKLRIQDNPKCDGKIYDLRNKLN